MTMARPAPTEQEQYNRVFVLGGKGSSEDDFKETFGKFGEVKDVWVVKDRKSGDEKGVTYITFSKASEAALAVEEMNGRLIGNNPKPLKVIMANNRREGNLRDPKEIERMLRLFIMVPKSYTKDEIRKKFEEYGDIEYVRLIKDKATGDSKGLAYVKFYRAYHAALALESCDSSFKAVFAVPREAPGEGARGDWGREDQWHEPRHDGGGYGAGPGMAPRGRHGADRGPPPDRYRRPYDSAILPSPVDPVDDRFAHRNGPPDIIKSYQHNGERRLECVAATTVTQEQLFRLFDIVPGLEFCEVDTRTGVAYVQFTLPQEAAYAKDKLSNLEYPPGYRLAVRYPPANYIADSAGGGTNVGTAAANINSSLQGLMQGDVGGNLQSLVDSIQKATTLLQQAGLSGSQTQQQQQQPLQQQQPIASERTQGGLNRMRFCNVPLPGTQPFASKEDPCAERLFIVSQPDSFPQHVLQDCFCRFGDLIDAFFMPGKNFGYAKYASKESAATAMEALHGQQICGMRVKVMKADPPKHGEEEDGSRGPKRLRIS